MMQVVYFCFYFEVAKLNMLIFSFKVTKMDTIRNEYV